VGFLGDLWGLITTPLYFAISGLLVGWHKLWSQIFPADSGIAWVLSIVGLTLVIRAALIPLFVKQIKSSRNMQLIQPKVKELQKKYGHDRERLAQETMKLYKDSGTNPFASCLPIILQMPIFLALFRLIDQAVKNPSDPKGVMTVTLNEQFRDATFLDEPTDDGAFAAVDASFDARIIADRHEARLNRPDAAALELADEDVAVVDVHAHHRSSRAHDSLRNEILHRADHGPEMTSHEHVREIHDRRAVSFER
jgi:YidC/Oxa1 family membrane protein insertase